MEKPRVWAGIDPGKSSYICALREDGIAVYLSNDTHPMEMLEWFKAMDQESNLMIVMVENVHAIHGSSAGASFSFGYNVSTVENIPQAAGLSVDKVNPKKWQKEVGVRSTIKGKAIKKEVADICKRLYPHVNVHGPKGGLLDGKSDSLMIAHYAKLKYR